ncbi:hypothetical protein EJB05_20176 [Eragrostis curvula]|uniref:Uncharacterized protein n=1 Tax=Eragrostis curvula TaxID=38414 RepID=A0A5J9UXR1_9POAL|nr:hypothetical protein EJB05_20176 [Eragrostis curvula]
MCEGIRELMPINEKMNFKVNCDGSKPPLDMIRDVIFCDGSFRFIEMEPHYLDSRSKATQLRWRINIFEREILSDNWEPCTSVESANISPADSGFLYLFSEIWDYKESKLTLNKVICSAPTLNLYEDDVVYMISRMKDEDKNGWVFVINTEIMKLERVVPFAAESLYDPRTFLQCDFSNYLSKATGMPATNSWMEKFNKEDQLPLMLYVCSILIGQCQLRNFAKRLTHKRPSYLEIWSLFHSGVASTMNVHIQELAQFANSNGQGKAASDSLNIFMRVSKEIEKLLAGNSFDDPCTSCEAIREKIDVAVGALDRLLHVVPSEVLDTWRGVISAACLDDESVDEWGIPEKFHAELTV